MEKPKVIYLKALFKKHKAENKLEKIIKDFVVQADIQIDGKEKLKVPPKDRSKVARQFILDNCERPNDAFRSDNLKLEPIELILFFFLQFISP